MLGNIPLKEFQRHIFHHYAALRNKQAQPATVNRAISKLFSYALECGEVDTHPLVRFPKLKEAKKIFRPFNGSIVPRLGRRGRQSLPASHGSSDCQDGDSNRRSVVAHLERADLVRKLLWVEFTKDDEPREIPLSQYATGYLSGLPRHLNTPSVVVNTRTSTRWVNPDKPLRIAADRVGLKVGLHDLRRFRCSHLLMQRVDVRGVQKLTGHSAISTTMRYARYVSSHALASIREAQANEDSQTQ